MRFRALAASAGLTCAALAGCDSGRPVEVSTAERDGSGPATSAPSPSSTTITTSEPVTTTATTSPRPVTSTSAPATTTTTTTGPACAPTGGPFGPYVFDILRAGPSQGLVAGTATIRSTADGGRTWTAACLPEETSGSILALAIRAPRAWAVGMPREGTRGFILRSTDGGRNWRPVDLPPGETSLKDIVFPDDDHGWAVGQHPQDDQRTYGPQYGSGAVLLRSGDGGATWTLGQEFDPDVAGGLNRLHFSDPAHGWAAGQTRANTPVLLATSDGGDTWQPRALPADVREVHDVVFVDAAHGWITAELGPVGGESVGGILATADGGATWATQWRAPQTPVSALWFADAGHGWAVANPAAGGTVLSTTDGGATWTATLTPGRSLTTISFAGTRDGWVAGQQGAYVYATTDGGATWEPRPITGP